MNKKKKPAEPPKDFEVEDADEAFRKTEAAARRMFSASKEQVDRQTNAERPKPKRR